MPLYALRVRGTDVVKVGFTTGEDPWRRVRHGALLRTQPPAAARGRVYAGDLDLLAWLPDVTLQQERELHTRFRERALTHEWYPASALPDMLAALNAVAAASGEVTMPSSHHVVSVLAEGQQ